MRRTRAGMRSTRADMRRTRWVATGGVGRGDRYHPTDPPCL
jgi:hypothetical protein